MLGFLRTGGLSLLNQTSRLKGNRQKMRTLRYHTRDMRALILLTATLHAQPGVAVVEKIAGKVAFYSPAGERTSEVKVGTYPHEIVRSLDRKSLYVTDNGILWMQYAGKGGNTISIIDPATHTRTGVIDLGEYYRPHGMAVHPATGQLVVTIENPDGLLLVDPQQRKVIRKFDVQGKSPHMVLFGPEGKRAYVSNTNSGTLASIELATGKTTVIPTGKYPQGGVLSPDGKAIYLTNAQSNRISIISTATDRVVGEIETAVYPNRVAITPDGKTLVYSLGEKGEAVGFADTATRKQTATVPLKGQPLSLTLTKDGTYAFAGIQSQDKIHVIDVAQRKIIRTITTPKDAGPDPALPLE
jgi:YVTN family beta-propeller protein